MLAIFDMDGTLTDSSTLLANSINYVRGKLNLAPLDKDTIIYQINNPNCNLAKYFYNMDKIEPLCEEWFRNYYSKYHNLELELYDGVEEMLKDIKQKDIKLAIATNAYRVSTLEALSHLNILDLFDDIVCFDDVKEGKPSPKMLNKLLNNFKLTNKDAIFIGDSQRDELASKRADIEFIKVAFGSNQSNVITKPIEINRKIEEYFCII
jgi:HAD superfamily hydrolase (TIGR01509 family)